MNEKTKTLNDYLNRNQETIDKINDGIMDRQFQAVSQVYLDLACFKDTRLGLLLLLSDQKWFSYIKDGLNRYNRRPNRTFKFAYPDFPFSEEELVAKYCDPALSREIFNRSPDTDLCYNFTKFLAQIQHQNNKADHKLPVVININVWPLQLNELTQKFAEIFSQQLHPEEFILRMHSSDPVTLPESLWLNQSILFIDDIQRLCAENSTLHGPLLINRRFLNKTIYAAPQVGDTELEIWKEEGIDFTNMQKIMERFELTAIYFSVCCLFSFTPFLIPIPKK